MATEPCGKPLGLLVVGSSIIFSELLTYQASQIKGSATINIIQIYID